MRRDARRVQLLDRHRAVRRGAARRTSGCRRAASRGRRGARGRRRPARRATGSACASARGQHQGAGVDRAQGVDLLAAHPSGPGRPRGPSGRHDPVRARRGACGPRTSPTAPGRAGRRAGRTTARRAACPTGTTTSSSSVARPQRRDEQVRAAGRPAGRRSHGRRPPRRRAARVGQAAQGEAAAAAARCATSCSRAELDERGRRRGSTTTATSRPSRLPELDERPPVERLADAPRAPGTARPRRRPRRRARPRRPGRAPARAVPSRTASPTSRRRRLARRGRARGGPRPSRPSRLERPAGASSRAAARVRSIQASARAGEPPCSTTPSPISPSSAPWPDARARSSIVGRLDRWTARSRSPARHSAIVAGRVAADRARARPRRPGRGSARGPARSGARLLGAGELAHGHGVARPVTSAATRPATRCASTALCRLPARSSRRRRRDARPPSSAAPTGPACSRASTPMRRARSRHARAALPLERLARPRPQVARASRGRPSSRQIRASRSWASVRHERDARGVELLDRARRRGARLRQQPEVRHRVGVLRVVLPQRDAGVRVGLCRRLEVAQALAAADLTGRRSRRGSGSSARRRPGQRASRRATAWSDRRIASVVSAALGQDEGEVVEQLVAVGCRSGREGRPGAPVLRLRRSSRPALWSKVARAPGCAGATPRRSASVPSDARSTATSAASRSRRAAVTRPISCRTAWRVIRACASSVPEAVPPAHPQRLAEEPLGRRVVPRRPACPGQST